MLDAFETDRSRLADIAVQILNLERSLSVLRAEETLIISEIFVHSLPVYPAPPPLTRVHSPTFLTQICRTWREIAVATHALWRAIQLTDGRILHEKRAHIFEVWMARSGSGPLSLRISDGSSTVSQMLSSLGPHRGCLEYLDICVSRHPLSVFKGPMPLLRYLVLTVTDFGHALSVDGAPFQETPNLVHCGMYLWGDRELQDYPEHGPDITLPCLYSLVLTLAYGIAGPGFFRSIVVPALRRLEMDEQFILPSPIVSLESFILKSGCTLQKLRIVQGRVEPAISYHRAFLSNISDLSTTHFGAETLGETTYDDEDSEIEAGSHSSDAESDSGSES
ncbi:hypothetical protein B0H14DRAFT_3555448 [Mycena olivaceomarginata]|nr:hypothetical protein B0H14DRAFT_3555448 [Mycena olivaceomarginata]